MDRVHAIDSMVPLLLAVGFYSVVFERHWQDIMILRNKAQMYIYLAPTSRATVAMSNHSTNTMKNKNKNTFSSQYTPYI